MAQIIRRAPLVVALILGAATVADAGGYHYRRHQEPAYVQTTPRGHVYVTPAGNLYVVPAPYAPAVPYSVLPYGTPVVPYESAPAPQGSRSYQGTSPTCQRFFC